MQSDGRLAALSTTVHQMNKILSTRSDLYIDQTSRFIARPVCILEETGTTALSLPGASWDFWAAVDACMSLDECRCLVNELDGDELRKTTNVTGRERNVLEECVDQAGLDSRR